MINILLAASENHVIGKDNKIPWHLPADLRYFKKLTTDNVVIMGRKTFDSIGKPLPNRVNIVITRQQSFTADGAIVAHSVAEALKAAKEYADKETFIIGGEEICKQALPFVDRIYLTRIHAYLDGDAYFPAPDLHEWMLVSSEQHEPDEKNKFAYDFEIYRRINN
nr:Dihydrofolate reductase [uncultured bacterium]